MNLKFVLFPQNTKKYITVQYRCTRKTRYIYHKKKYKINKTNAKYFPKLKTLQKGLHGF